MAYEVGKLYFVNLDVYPLCLNEDSPLPSISTQTDGQVVDAHPFAKNVHSRYGHVALLLHFDPTSHLGVLFMGTCNPQQPQRFVPWLGTPRLPHQPLRPFIPDPPSTFSELPGYLCFSHAIRVKVLEDVEEISRTVPGLCHVKHPIVLDHDVHSYVRPVEIEYLKSLHTMYWEHKRYDEHGMVLVACGGSRNAGGSGNAAGDSGNSSAPAEHGGGRGGRLGRGDSRFAVVDVEAIDPSSPLFDPIHPVTGLRHSQMMRLAALEDYERYIQSELVDGSMHLECELPPAPCTLLPVTQDGIKAYATVVPPAFPYHMLYPSTLPMF